jgi:hypothetical protein
VNTFSSTSIRDTRNTEQVRSGTARRGHPAVALGSRSVPDGVIEVESHSDGWYLVAIGRARSTKRFNLTRSEAAELARVLTEQVLTEDRPGIGGGQR